MVTWIELINLKTEHDLRISTSVVDENKRGWTLDENYLYFEELKRKQQDGYQQKKNYSWLENCFTEK